MEANYQDQNSKRSCNENDIQRTKTELLAFGFPTCASFFLLNPTWSILPIFYAKYFGLDLAIIASIVLFSRFFDAISDPVVGSLSDWHRMKGGSRKTWVVWGAVAIMVSSYFLYMPSKGVSHTYFCIWSIIFLLSWTIVDIPHVAWGSEIATGYNNRTKIYSYRVIFICLGQSLFFGLPLLPMFEAGEYDPDFMRSAAIIGSALMIVAVIFALIKAPNGVAFVKQGRSSISETFNAIIKNKPLLHFLTTYLFAGLSFGMWMGLLFTYLDAYLNFGVYIALIFFLGNLLGLISVPIWVRIVNLTDKAKTWALGQLFYAVLLFTCWFISPGDPWWFLLITVGGGYAAVSCMNLTAVSILADIGDYGIVKFKQILK